MLTSGPNHVRYQKLEFEVGINNLYVPTTDDVDILLFQQSFTMLSPETRSMTYLKPQSKQRKRD